MSNLSQVQEAALGYRGALNLAEQNGWGVESPERQALTGLWNHYLSVHGDWPLSNAYNETAGWQDYPNEGGLHSAVAYFQGMVWGAENMGGVHGRNEGILENNFNTFSRIHGGANLDYYLSQRLDPTSYQAIKDQPWWKW